MKLLNGTSHTDHGLTDAQMKFVLEKFGDRDAFFIETVTLPDELGTLPCGLHGPDMGDEPVPETEVIYERRGDRQYESRLCDRPIRQTSKLTVIGGPTEGEACVLYTAYGGPCAPREPKDPTLPDNERADSEKFWSEHALSI